VTPEGVSLRFGPRTGKYRPWWKQIAVTVHGAEPARMTIPDHPRAGTVLIAGK
jgi:alpha-glucosidase